MSTQKGFKPTDILDDAKRLGDFRSREELGRAMESIAESDRSLMATSIQNLSRRKGLWRKAEFACVLAAVRQKTPTIGPSELFGDEITQLHFGDIEENRSIADTHLVSRGSRNWSNHNIVNDQRLVNSILRAKELWIEVPAYGAAITQTSPTIVWICAIYLLKRINREKLLHIVYSTNSNNGFALIGLLFKLFCKLRESDSSISDILSLAAEVFRSYDDSGRISLCLDTHSNALKSFVNLVDIYWVKEGLGLRNKTRQQRRGGKEEIIDYPLNLLLRSNPVAYVLCDDKDRGIDGRIFGFFSDEHRHEFHSQYGKEDVYERFWICQRFSGERNSANLYEQGNVAQILERIDRHSTAASK